ncbi:hypothetical protein BC833DRAFT_304012 [Globomyces pollinis-pini]|nr:hypothetical protein BC833DRAFT_304012 [Globomyces pollinis-pini]
MMISSIISSLPTVGCSLIKDTDKPLIDTKHHNELTRNTTSNLNTIFTGTQTHQPPPHLLNATLLKPYLKSHQHTYFYLVPFLGPYWVVCVTCFCTTCSVFLFFRRPNFPIPQTPLLFHSPTLASPIHGFFNLLLYMVFGNRFSVTDWLSVHFLGVLFCQASNLAPLPPQICLGTHPLLCLFRIFIRFHISR